MSRTNRRQSRRTGRKERKSAIVPRIPAIALPVKAGSIYLPADMICQFRVRHESSVLPIDCRWSMGDSAPTRSTRRCRTAWLGAPGLEPGNGGIKIGRTTLISVRFSPNRGEKRTCRFKGYAAFPTMPGRLRSLKSRVGERTRRDMGDVAGLAEVWPS